MKKARKVLSFVIALVMLLSVIPLGALPALAEEIATDAVISVKSTYGKGGTSVVVDLVIENNPGILGMTLDLEYDETKATLTEVQKGDALSAMAFTPPKDLSSGCRLPWDAEDVSDEDVKDGVIVSLTFELAEDVAVDDIVAISISYDYGAIIDRDMNPLEIGMVNGFIKVIDYTPGDLNEDGVVNTTDVVILRRYIAGGYDVSIRKVAADVNDDGMLNTTDVVYIRRFTAGGYGVELKPSTKLCDHEMEATAAVAATCTENGNIAYWYCTVCKRYFTDAKGAKEVAVADTVVDALGHDIVIDPYKPATKEETGLTEGSHCSRCTYVEVEQQIIPILTGYKVEYDISNGDEYIAKQSAPIDADKYQYFSDEGLTLPQLQIPGYRFIGWSYTQASNATIISKIELGETGDKKLYAHWEKIVYDIIFDSPDVPWESITYTVDKGATLTNPTCFGYTFMGWSNDEGFIVTRILPGTTGHMTLHANWTSDRNKATSYKTYADPIIIEDDVNGQFLFVYNIGRIDNVPLNEVEFIGKTETLNYNNEVTVKDYVDSSYADSINKMVSNATTKSSGWTLSKEWNDMYETTEEVGELSEKSDERTTSEGKVIGGNYFVSNSEGGSSYISTESGSSASNSSKITTENSMGINSSYDTSTEKYCDAKLGVTNETEVSANVSAPVGIAKVSAGVKNTTTVSAETSSGRKDNEAYHVDGSMSSYVGTVDTSDSSSYFNSTASNSSNWNSTTSYGQSYETAREDVVTEAIKEQLSKTTSNSISKALGGEDSKTEAIEDTAMSSEEYSTIFTYSEGTSEETTKSFSFNSSEPGYYRIITAGTVHVYAVVGYDVATASYYTYCFNVLDDNKREILDYSKDNMNFNDCENSIVTFEVPYEVNEYILGVAGKTNGLAISYDGKVTGFTPDEEFEGTVVVPQYEGKNNADGTYTAVKVTSIDPAAFAAVKETVKTVVLPIYITEIPEGLFEGCTNLETVIAYGVTKIGKNAFKDCTSLKNFCVDNAVVSLGENAFENVPEVSVVAYDSAVADAAIKSGAKSITVNLSKITDTYENKTVSVSDAVDYFALIGDGSVYNNVRIESDAKETMISNMRFAYTSDTPLVMSSEKVTLARVTVENSPNFALVLKADQTELNLLGDVTLNASVDNTVISKSVTLGWVDQSTTSSLTVNGQYLVCGEVVNSGYLNVEPTVITEEEYENYLNSCIVTFDANGGETTETSKVVYLNQQYGELPTPTREYYTFNGWFTAAQDGEQIIAETVVNTTAPQTLYAQWTRNSFVVTYDANGGTVATASEVQKCGEAFGTMPTPTRDYYTFNGWYTAASGGECINSDTVIADAVDMTLYAQWTQNPVSGWVKASELPADAEVVNRKWSYNLTTNITSSNQSEAGYTLYNTTSAWSDYGAWSAWSSTAASASDSRQVETKTVTDREGYTNYKYYIYRTSDGYGYGTQGYNTSTHGACTKYDEINLSYSLPVYNSSLGTYGPYNSSMFSHSYDSYWFFGGSSWVPAVTHTEYRYRDRTLVYTYYHTKTEALESTTAVSEGNGISNVVEWVQYRAK